MKQLVIKSPAKLNLYLDVLRKRPDGYHDIETIFEKISLFDIVSLRPAKKGIRVTSNNPALPTDSRNLAYRAARALFDKGKVKSGIWIDIGKNIPIAGGLGGGSSNAAAVLLGINRLFKLGFKRMELVEIGRTLGADVPFFLYDCSFAVGTARGDDISPIYMTNNTNIWHIIIALNFSVLTKTIYNKLNLGLTPGKDGVKIPLRFISKNDIENLAVCLYNKLEGVALKDIRIIGAMKGLLIKEGAYGALLSGSGPTVFGITKTREEAIAVKERIHKVIRGGCRVLVAKTFN